MNKDTNPPRRIEVEDAEQFEAEALAEEAPAAETSEALEARLVALEDQLATKHEDFLRAVADLHNFRRRAAEERAQQLQFANEGLVSELLPVLDNFDRATECQVEGEAAQNVLRGVCMIREQLYGVLTNFGVEQMVTVGRAFDPALHEAIERVETREAAEGTIVAEVLAGYTLNGRVIRAAKVKVAAAPSTRGR